MAMSIGAYETDQEAFWAGEFGTSYIERHAGARSVASNLSFFGRALRMARGIETCMEFGASIGMNLRALAALYPNLVQSAVEINDAAVDVLAGVVPVERIFHGSVLAYRPDRTFDLVLTKGVLIHIAPSHLPAVYDTLVASCGRYLLVAEYFNPTPVSVPYRGHDDRLFKRDFAGEILDRHPVMRLVDYGFVYHRDPDFPQDDLNWFLLERDRAGAGP